MIREKYLALTSTEKKDYIITLNASCIQRTGKGLSMQELEQFNILKEDVVYHFQSLTKLHLLCGYYPPTKRDRKLSSGELQAYIKNCITSTNDNGCWMTNKLCVDPDSGRTKVRYKHKTISLYRLAYIAFKGPIESGKFILHSCDNEKCFNPEHLRQGTAKDNSQDRVARSTVKKSKDQFKRHSLQDPYDYPGLLALIKSRIVVSEKNEWLYVGNKTSAGYPKITIKGKTYAIHRLLLANILGIKYEEVILACHKFPETSPFKDDAPKRHDLNPEHLYNGTAVDNMKDTLSYNKSCNLTKEQVEAIHVEITNSDKTKPVSYVDAEIASRYSVSSDTVRLVRLGKRYTYSTVSPTNKRDTRKTVIMQDKNGMT